MISEGGTKREDGVTAEPGRARRGGEGGGKILRTRLRYPGVAVGSHGGFGGWLGGDPFAQCLEEEFQLDGLGEVVVHARRQTLLAATRQHLRGHGHNRNVPIRAFPAADFARGSVAIHLRHLAIHEDQVVGQEAEHLHRLPAMRAAALWATVLSSTTRTRPGTPPNCTASAPRISSNGRFARTSPGTEGRCFLDHAVESVFNNCDCLTGLTSDASIVPLSFWRTSIQ